MNDVLSIFFTIVLLAMPIFVIIYYLKNFRRMADKSFSNKWGSTYDGLRTNSRIILVFPVFFLARRIIFILLAFNMKDKANEQYIDRAVETCQGTLEDITQVCMNW